VPPTAAKFLFVVRMFLFALLISVPLNAQVNRGGLSGTVIDTSGKAVPDAKISVKDSVSGQSVQTQTDAAGQYHFADLAPGDYEISVSAQGFSTNISRLTMAPGVNQTMNLTLGGVLSLEDLGISSTQAQGSEQDQARLDKRSHMLKVHQRLGLIATVPLVAALFAGPAAGGRSTSTTDRYLHTALGSAAADLYFTSAYFAIRAPKIPGTQTRGPIRLHKALAWIHGPGMIMTPILGAMAFDQKSRGERVHGIASAHGAVAVVTAAAYGAAILSVSVKF